MKKTDVSFWVLVGVTALVIHAVFCIQAFMPLSQGGMASQGLWLLIFYPHYVFLFFSPPPYPIALDGNVVRVNYLDFWGKMLVAFPFSILYACFLVSVGAMLRRFLKVFST